ncbi:uncharacterized protein LOC121248173 [Juglans microcarpa x Juglans regia]|uniref:uncharacterized protein LOC121248173 n=1 Tax=Juglans microcarpa x Juglans regia TaxID=2249226 RepID=UPI001B7E0A09|nr:uncharacterized protein LOC121248173 [Juglans microcarpa x Juglans regia]
MECPAIIKPQSKHEMSMPEQGAQDHRHHLDSSSSDQLETGSLNDLSSLLQQLPIKRGLSKHYDGKSRSFTSLSNVKCMEDLVKIEHPYNKKLKSCKSYVGLGKSQSHRSSRPPMASSSKPRLNISKKLSNSKGSCSLLSVNRSGSFLRSGSPASPPHRSTSSSSISNQTPALLA